MAQAISHFRLDGPPHRLRLHQFRQKDYLTLRTRKSARLVEIDVEFTDARRGLRGARLSQRFAHVRARILFNTVLAALLSLVSLGSAALTFESFREIHSESTPLIVEGNFLGGHASVPGSLSYDDLQTKGFSKNAPE